jgi:hypothetical protein
MQPFFFDIPTAHLRLKPPFEYPEGMISHVPKGLRPTARGCEERATPGRGPLDSYAKGVA